MKMSPRDLAKANIARVLRIARVKADSASKHAANAEWWEALPVIAKIKHVIDDCVRELELPEDESVQLRRKKKK